MKKLARRQQQQQQQCQSPQEQNDSQTHTSGMKIHTQERTSEPWMFELRNVDGVGLWLSKACMKMFEVCKLRPVIFPPR